MSKTMLLSQEVRPNKEDDITNNKNYFHQERQQIKKSNNSL
jgi:hypothetical protein